MVEDDRTCSLTSPQFCLSVPLESLCTSVSVISFIGYQLNTDVHGSSTCPSRIAHVRVQHFVPKDFLKLKANLLAKKVG